MKHGLTQGSKSSAYIGSSKILLDVPVYRVSKEKYELRQREFITKQLKLNAGQYGEEAYRRYPELKTQTESHLWNNYGGNWLYNEIIGFIRLFFLFNQVRGEYFSVEAKRIVRTRRKVFRPLGYEVTTPENISVGSSSHEIFDRIRIFLSRAQNEKELKKHFIDSSILENIGAHIDWNALLEEQFKTK